MPYDPNIPQANTEIDAVQMRGQLNGLKDLIDAVPTISSAQVDAVTTLPAVDPATASAQVVGGILRLSFGIPAGMQGVPGVQGPPFANAVVDSVSTLAPGTPATVGVSFDGSWVHFTFGIPQGFTGDPGPQGVPGEVTAADLNAGLAVVTAGSSANTNGVPTLSTPFTNDPPTQADMETMRQAYNDLVQALRRT